MSDLEEREVHGVKWTLCPDQDTVLKFPKASRTGYLGFVYVVEVGEHVKIGQTRDPRSRLRAIAGVSDIYGDRTTSRALISPPHTNFTNNEKLLHRHFSKGRRKGEFFDLTLDQFIQSCPILAFRDDSERLQAKTESVVQGFMDFVTGRSDHL